jgi:hypothetical protein
MLVAKVIDFVWKTEVLLYNKQEDEEEEEEEEEKKKNGTKSLTALLLYMIFPSVHFPVCYLIPFSSNLVSAISSL